MLCLSCLNVFPLPATSFPPVLLPLLTSPVPQFVFWALGTILGGALGYLAMWHPALALSPYGLVVVMVVVALVVGLLGVTKARVGITLVLMTLSTLILVRVQGLKHGLIGARGHLQPAALS